MPNWDEAAEPFTEAEIQKSESVLPLARGVTMKPTGETRGLPDMNVLQIAEVLNHWLANYTGPSEDPLAVEIAIAFEHVKRAIAVLEKRLNY